MDAERVCKRERPMAVPVQQRDLLGRGAAGGGRDEMRRAPDALPLAFFCLASSADAAAIGRVRHCFREARLVSGHLLTR